MRAASIARLLAPVPIFFALRIASALLLLKLSASAFPVGDFANFAQFLLFASFLNLVAVGGTQNGLVRQSAAAPDRDALAVTHGAALLIWAGFAPALLLLALLAGPAIAAILTGSAAHGGTVATLAALAIAAGPGQIWCSILSGRKRVAASLAAQGVGLVAGTAAAAWWIGRGEPAAAAIGFASGPLLTMMLAWLATRGIGLWAAPARLARTAVTPLLRYSGALAATAGYTALVLFGLRALFRDSFGAEALGYWLAANRISDMSTQLLGLFMIQFFVPHVATIASEAKRRALILRCWAAAAGAIAVGIGLFSLAAEPLVRLFLSDAFVPAIPIIRAYMIGDLLRVWTTLAIFAAFARGAPGRYAAIEMATITTMAVVAYALIGQGDPRAPQIAYVAAYALTAVLVTLAFLRGERRRPRFVTPEPIA